MSKKAGVESKFQAELIIELRKMFKGCMVIKNDPNHTQGIPDLLVLFGKTWAALECKKNATAPHQPNQEYYVQHMDDMSFAAFIFPENKDEILHGLQLAFRAYRKARVPKCVKLSLD